MKKAVFLLLPWLLLLCSSSAEEFNAGWCENGKGDQLSKKELQNSTGGVACSAKWVKSWPRKDPNITKFGLKGFVRAVTEKCLETRTPMTLLELTDPNSNYTELLAHKGAAQCALNTIYKSGCHPETVDNVPTDFKGVPENVQPLYYVCNYYGKFTEPSKGVDDCQIFANLCLGNYAKAATAPPKTTQAFTTTPSATLPPTTTAATTAPSTEAPTTTTAPTTAPSTTVPSTTTAAPTAPPTKAPTTVITTDMTSTKDPLTSPTETTAPPTTRKATTTAPTTAAPTSPLPAVSSRGPEIDIATNPPMTQGPDIHIPTHSPTTAAPSPTSPETTSPTSPKTSPSSTPTKPSTTPSTTEAPTTPSTTEAPTPPPEAITPPAIIPQPPPIRKKPQSTQRPILEINTQEQNDGGQRRKDQLAAEAKAKAKEEDEGTNLVGLWVTLAVVIVVGAIVGVVVTVVMRRRAKKKKEAAESALKSTVSSKKNIGGELGKSGRPPPAGPKGPKGAAAKKPPAKNKAPALAMKQMEAGVIDNKFKFDGPLTVDVAIRKGQKVEHATGDDDGKEIDHVIFDHDLNKVVDIGSNIEKIETEELATVTVDRTDNTVEGPSRKGRSKEKIEKVAEKQPTKSTDSSPGVK